MTVLALAWLLVKIAGSPNMHWPDVFDYLFSKTIMLGVLITIQLTILCMMLGTVLGLLVAIMRMSSSVFLRSAAAGYVWFFRGTPVLVQLIFWYNLSLLFPRIGLFVPFTDVGGSAATNSVISALMASVLGLGLNVGAYMAEIFRGGILAVDPGQVEAATALGMHRSRVLRKIVLPQAMRVVIPPSGNQFIDLMKATAMVAFIAGGDLLTRTQQIYSMNFLVIPLLVVASLWYLALTTLATVGQHFLERRFGRSTTHTRPKTSASSRLANLAPWRRSKELA
ncbi:amino acid ABC transporter permease [Solicola gregarius]|uniref:Amino acid ABC transporter permease n=1 Tax=Solicola gregarius TaxID=2908642 RepID=A0AA46TJ78_9ACTN|nr:amino acid ABC transporter permease [Solicola gregarius]UYM06354.1 amino acid ABC transporter permease [Solicola gregarius]